MRCTSHRIMKQRVGGERAWGLSQDRPYTKNTLASLGTDCFCYACVQKTDKGRPYYYNMKDTRNVKWALPPGAILVAVSHAYIPSQHILPFNTGMTFSCVKLLWCRLVLIRCAYGMVDVCGGARKYGMVDVVPRMPMQSTCHVRLMFVWMQTAPVALPWSKQAICYTCIMP